MSTPTTDEPPDDIDEREAKIIEALRFEGESIDAAYTRYLNLLHRGVDLDYLAIDTHKSTDELDSEIPIVGILSDGTAELIEEGRQRDENVLSGH